MTNYRYIKVLLLWCIPMSMLNAQADYCSDTLFFCNFGTTILEGNNELVGPFDLSTTYFHEIEHDFDGQDLFINISSSFYNWFTDSLRIEDLGAGTVCYVPYVVENYARAFFELPDIECIQFNYQDPSLDFNYTINHRNKFNYCVGDRVTYDINQDQSYYSPHPPNDILTIDRISQSLGDILSVDSFSVDLVYNEPGYELFELTTYNDSECAFKMYYPVEVYDTVSPKVLYQDSISIPSSFCQGQQIDLSSENGQSLHWEVSNGMVFNGSNFSFTLDVPGTYQIKVKEYGFCDCSQPAYYTVVVEEAIAPSIICTGTLCDGGEVTYYTDQECDSYIWSVVQGSITGGGGSDDDYVTVLWSDASSGSISLGTPSCSSSMCPEVTIKDISIIDASAPMIGLDSICTGDVSHYSVPDYNGTTFSWEVSEGGYILDGQDENNISVKWKVGTERSKAKVSVTYENCDINCQGYSEKEITILPVFEIVLDQNEYCIHGEIELTNNIGDKVDYAILTPRGDTLSYENIDTVIIVPDTTGIYGFIANNNLDGICNPYAQTTTLVSFYPQPVGHLNGPQAICKLQTTSYSVDLSNPNETVYWEVFDGDLTEPLHTSTSLDIDYQWTSDGPYQIIATAYNAYTNCSSESTTFAFQSDYEISGLDTACIYTTYWYEYNGNPVTSNKWIISPDSAGIILGADGNKVNIYWQLAGNHTISIDQCDETTEHNIYVEPEAIFTHNAPENLCSNDSVFVTFHSSIPTDFIVVRKWSLDTVATDEMPMGYLRSGQYDIYSTSTIGCEKSEYLLINSINTPFTKIRIKGERKWCPPGSTRLEAWYNNSNYTYQWFKDGVAIPGATWYSYNTNQFGSYTLQVTNSEGCVSTSDAILLEKCCDNDSQPINDYSVDIAETIDQCDVRTFEVLQTYFSSSFVWRARKFGIYYYMGQGTEVTYTFPEAGTYTVYATGDTLCQDVEVKVCGVPTDIIVCEGGRITVTIPVVADFNYSQTCGGKNVKFTDNSSKIGGTAGLTYEWDFGETSSANNTSTLRNPSHTYDSIGTYSVKLKITHSSGCITTKSRLVTVRARPEIDIETSGNFCYESFLRFYRIIDSGSNLSYKWNFGDPDSGSSNTTSQSNPYHKFSKPGTYTVRLQVKDPNDCIDTKTISVTIVENDLSGEIESDKIYPKCPGEEVELSAPSAPFYRWNNGDSVQHIQIVDEGNYRVTLSDEYGCVHITDNHFVDDYVFQKVDIFARKYNSNGVHVIQYDSVEICHGDQFDIEASYIPQSSYTWNNSTKESNVLSFEDDLQMLAPGRYEYYTKVREIPRAYKIQIALIKGGYDIGPNGADGSLNVDTKQALVDFQTDNGLAIGALDDATLTALNIFPCEVEAGPFIIIIKPSPDDPIVESDLATNCEGELSTMSISNSNDDQNYVWTTGVEGTEIVAYAAGKYQVTTTDTFGCVASSEAIEIYEVPEVSAWMTGCREVCFPEEICVDLRAEFTYTLIKDGEELEIIDDLSGNLAIDSIGDYQMKATNSDGCSAISDLLVLTKTPDDHALSGIVYFDENENNIFDLSDVLLEGVPVYLINPDSLISETVTDANGYYEFLGFEDYDLQTVIDPSLVDYILTGSIDSTVLYETCIEERLLDFPLIDNCQQVPMNIEEQICPGKTIIIDGTEYGDSDSDTLVYQKAINCDSIVYLKISPYSIPEISLRTEATCVGEQLGQVDINLITGDSLLFSIDENQEMYSDSLIQNLSTGNHTLYVHTQEGCIYPHEFEILEMPVPSLELETISTCIGFAEGLATLTVTAEDSLYYSIDQGDSYTDQLIFDSLTAGIYEVWAIDSMACIYEAQFEVTEFEEPQYSLSYVHSCEEEDNGIVNITLSNDIATEFRLSPDSAWIQDITFEDLKPGIYSVYSRSEFGCLDSAEFTINTIPEPLVDFIITEECESHSLGTIEALSDSLLLYSIDGEAFDTITVFDSLIADSYTIYVQDEHLCVYEFFVEIPLLPSPEIYLNPSTTCLEESMGVLKIQDESNITFLFSIDDSVYNDQVVYDGLAAGIYTLYVQNEIGCTYPYEFEIEETLPPTVSLSNDDSCPNDDTGVLVVTSSDPDDIVFVNNGDASNERVFDNLQPGIYEIWVEDTLGCRTYAETEIFELPPLIVEMPILDADCYKNQVTITPIIESHEGALNYKWGDGSTQDYFVATKIGQYAVTISDDCDAVSHSWDLVVRHTGTDDQLYSSNIFSPNEDGINDCFNVIVDSDLELIYFRYVIFDRWGNKMFTTTSTADCWDGRYNSVLVEQGVYVVISEATVLECDGQKKIRKISDVTVIR